MKYVLKFSFLFFALFLFTTTSSAQTSENDVTIIELTQKPGQFVTQELNLKPGKYQFKIVNDGVDKEVGFVIQKSTDKGSDVMKNHVPNSFTTALVKKGDTEYTGIVNLTKGSYNYLCPLNPTPHDSINVE